MVLNQKEWLFIKPLFNVFAYSTLFLLENVNSCPDELGDLFECFENYNSLSYAIHTSIKTFTQTKN